MLLPYRVKNPPKRFPYVTLGIISANVIVFAMTSRYFLVIREEVVVRYAFHLWVAPFVNFISSSFLHADLLHLLGNMWFLWVFGPAVEDRLGLAKFVAVYAATGLVGDLSQTLLDVAFNGQNQPIIGASACIMGIAGAYWFAFPWSKVCVFYWIWWFWHGVFEVSAHWVITAYILLDLWSGLLGGVEHVSGGVASFAHVGGGIAGVLLCALMRVRCDTEEVSEARAVHADMRDLENMPFDALQSMLEAEPDNTDVLRAAIVVAMRQGKQQVVADAIARLGSSLVLKDRYLVYSYLMDLRGDPSIYQSVHLLRLAGQFEQSCEHDMAINVYKLIADTRPTEMEAENALYRMAYCYWAVYKHREYAGACLAQLQKRFPRGQMMPFAVSLWKQIEAAGSGQPPTGA